MVSARVATSAPVRCGTAAATQTYAATRALGLGLASTDFTVTSPTCGKQVSASLAFQFAASGILPYVITLNSTACYPI